MLECGERFKRRLHERGALGIDVERAPERDLEWRQLR